jgi:hypothetical protein
MLSSRIGLISKILYSDLKERTQTCKQEYASTFEGRGVSVKSVVTLCTHFAQSKCLAVQMNCTPVTVHWYCRN